MKTYIKQNIFKIATAILILILGIYSIWSFILLQKMTGVVDNQGNQIVVQMTAWNVFLSSLSEQDRTNFVNAVNQSLQVKK